MQPPTTCPTCGTPCEIVQDEDLGRPGTAFYRPCSAALPGLTLRDLARQAHATAVAKGFWDDIDGNPDAERWVFPAKIALIHSELSEALQADRSPSPNAQPLLEELADAVIRIADLCGRLGGDLESAVAHKLAANQLRPHRHGKRY